MNTSYIHKNNDTNLKTINVANIGIADAVLAVPHWFTDNQVIILLCMDCMNMTVLICLHMYFFVCA